MKLILAMAPMLLGAVLASGCATPAPVKDASAVTAELMEQLDAEVTRFKLAREAGDTAILRHTADSRKTNATARAGFTDLLADEQAAGNVRALDLYSRLVAATEALKASDDTLVAEKAKIDAEMAGLLKPLPDVSSPLGNARNAVAALGKDRSTADQFDEALAVLKAVQASTKDHREKLKKAMAEAP